MIKDDGTSTNQIHFKGDQIVQDQSSKKKDSYFGIDNEERIQKFLQKLNKTLRKILYDEKNLNKNEEDNTELKKDHESKRKSDVVEAPKNTEERKKPMSIIDSQVPQS